MSETTPDSFTDLYDPCLKRFIVEDEYISLRVDNPQDPGIQFYAAMDWAHIENKHVNVARFVIRTIDLETRERHAYFEQYRASDIAIRAVHHFQNTLPVDGIKFRWVKEFGHSDQPSDNYLSYILARKKFCSSLLEGDARSEAVHESWTMQKIAIPLGFTAVADVSEHFDRSDSSDWPHTVTGLITK